MSLLDKIKDSINFMKDLPKAYQEIYDTYVKGEIYGSSRGGGISFEKALEQAKEAGATDEELEEMKEDYQKELDKIKAKGFKSTDKKESLAKGGMVNKPRKMSNGGMANKGIKVRGQGAAIRGTKFKGIF